MRVVAPLVRERPELRALGRLEPIFEIDGTRLALHAGELAAIPARLLPRDPVADLSGEDHAIRGALDMFFSGF